MKKENVKCDICNVDNATLLFNKEGYDIVKCSICGLVYVNPRLKYSILNDMYNSNKISPYTYYIDNIKNDEKAFRIKLSEIEKYKKPGRILDVGCGVGVLLNEAKKRGWETYGLDLQKKAVDYANNHFNVNARLGTLENNPFKDGFFDLIVMNDFLEHVPNPAGSLKIASKLLKKNGIIFLSTPDINSFLANISGKKWIHLKPNEHIYYFSLNTLRILLNNAGLNIFKYTYFGRFRGLGTILSKMQTYSKLFYKMIRFFKLEKLLNKLSFYVNPRDEISIFARKTKA